MSLTITFPLSDEQAVAVVVAADAFAVEPWEMAMHALIMREWLRPIPKDEHAEPISPQIREETR